jgi:hypothetical protein
MRCKVTVGDESVCFLCLEPSEVENLTPGQNRRFTLTGFAKYVRDRESERTVE